MIITTAQERADASTCCGCGLPTCAAPRKECQSITGTADAADNEDSAYDAAYDAWAAGGYVGTEPTAPEGYDDWQHGTVYAPFAEPEGEDDDPVPNLYRRYREADEFTGTEGHYDSNIGPDEPVLGGPLSDPGRTWTHQSVTWSVETPWFTQSITSSSGGGIWWDDQNGDAGCEGSVDAPTTYIASSVPAFDHGTNDWVAAENACERTATTYFPANSKYGMANAEGTYGTPVSVQAGCPSAWQREEDGVSWAVNFQRIDGAQTLSDPITKDELIAAAIAKLPTEWPDPAEGAECIAKSETDWPTIGSFKTESEWPACDALPIVAEATSTVTRVRYRFGVPTDFSTTEVPRSTWIMQWDEVFFPDGHDATINDPEVTPPDPLPNGWTHPQIADPDAPTPTLVASREWTWGGSMESPWSPWYVLEPPDEPGEVRPVNVMIKCWKSTRLGVAPTAYGETYDIPT